MAHYAFLDENNIVTEVIVGRDENDLVDGIESWEQYYGNLRNMRCLRTSYNGNIRKNFAAVGSTYDEKLDAFIPLKPFDSWVLDEEVSQWVSPIPYPSDNKSYVWDENVTNWVLAIDGKIGEQNANN